MANDTCPACGSETRATSRTGASVNADPGGRLPQSTNERATCRCGTPLIRTRGAAWQIDTSTPDGHDTKRAIDEGWKRSDDDGEFEPNTPELEGRLTCTLQQLREGWNPNLIDRSDELRGGQ